jgi:inorganic pyrophosphatase
VDVRIETPRWSFAKGNAGAGHDFVSPLPCPFNYGSVPGTVAEDGDAQDALVLGPRLGRGELCRRSALGLVSFLDAGRRDDKLVCGTGPELDGALPRLSLRLFFTVYALAKRIQNRLRGERGRTRFEGLAVFEREAG